MGNYRCLIHDVLNCAEDECREENKRGALHVEIADLRRQLTAANADAAEWRRACDRADERERALHAEIERLRLDLTTASEERDAANERADDWMKRHDDAQSRLAFAEDRATRAERALDEERAGAATMREALGYCRNGVCVLLHQGGAFRAPAQDAIDRADAALATDAGRALLDERREWRSLASNAIDSFSAFLNGNSRSWAEGMLAALSERGRALATAPGKVNTCRCGSYACRCLNAGCGGFMNSRTEACACEKPTPACEPTAPGKVTP